jgi:hypothetical protein
MVGILLEPKTPSIQPHPRQPRARRVLSVQCFNSKTASWRYGYLGFNSRASQASAMTEQTPTIRTADQDGDGPAKRRRRPALSCVECRSRKVRCDREKPCGACTRIRSTTCTYRPLKTGVRERSPASGNSVQDQRNSARSSPQPHAPFNELDTAVNRYVAPGILGEYGRQGLWALPAVQPNLNLESTTNSGDSVLISSLLDRIRSLESKVVSEEGRSTDTNLPIREDTGQFVKSKYYGQSHWMNAIDPVSMSHLRVFSRDQHRVSALMVHSTRH